MTVSVADFTVSKAIVRGDVTASDVANIGAVVLQSATLDYTETTTGKSFLPNMRGTGTVRVDGVAELGEITMSGNVELDNAGTINADGGSPGQPPGSGIVAEPGLSGDIVIKNLAGAIWSDMAVVPDDYGADILPELSGMAAFVNDGTLIGGGGGTVFVMDLQNNGIGEVAPTVANSELVLDENVSGTGTFELDKNAMVTTDLNVGSGQTFNFVDDPTATSPSTLTVGDITDFAGTISGFDMGGSNRRHARVRHRPQFHLRRICRQRGRNGWIAHVHKHRYDGDHIHRDDRRLQSRQLPSGREYQRRNADDHLQLADRAPLS